MNALLRNYSFFCLSSFSPLPYSEFFCKSTNMTVFFPGRKKTKIIKTPIHFLLTLAINYVCLSTTGLLLSYICTTNYTILKCSFLPKVHSQNHHLHPRPFSCPSSSLLLLLHHFKQKYTHHFLELFSRKPSMIPLKIGYMYLYIL